MGTVGRGARLGVDVGTVRIGLAVSDPDGLVATPVETVARATSAPPEPQAAERRGGKGPAAAEPVPVDAGTADLRRIADVVREFDVACVYVGLPRHLSGKESWSSQAVRTYAGVLAQVVAPVQVRLVDERMSTVTAHQALYASGRSGRRHRTVVDQAAAVVILQSALDAERASGARCGEPVDGSPAAGDAPTGADRGRGGPVSHGADHDVTTEATQ
ncbi:Holliday junction resolvase RuvX [Cellulomonas carbonis]|uniref:Holliday junction resolvase RuvX n=1 Tax=Cellulomonas carbonis TaxID=1386092 RepID=UPI0009DCDF9B|nr:Holliday junction resolvase RuvX [Cellulomonas carbonis]